MKPLSASECISPAIGRTKLILFTPFRKGRSWKLSATAYVCRFGTMFFPFPLIYLMFVPAAQRAGGKLAVGALVAGLLFLTALFILFFHLCSRLQFAYFDIVLNHGEFVAPAWRKYGPQSLPWTGLKVALGTALTFACTLPILAYVRHIAPLFLNMHVFAPGQPPPPEFIRAMFAGYGIILLVFGPAFLISSLFADFVVPSLALEDTGIAEAFRRMFLLIRQEPGEFALYALLKIGLGSALYIGTLIACELAIIIVSVIMALILGLIGFLLHMIGIPSLLLTAVAVPLVVAWYVLILGYGLLFPMGIIFTFLDAYALYFLGGRYPMLGDLLDYSTAPPYPCGGVIPPPAPNYLPPNPTG